MRVVEITKHGAPEVLKVRERPDPAVNRDQVLVDVRAVGINFADIMARLGFYPDAPKPPCVIGYEFAGVVAEVGADVTTVEVGQKVIGGARFGCYADKVLTTADALFPLPDSLSFQQGAAIPVNYATAYAALIDFGSLKAGEKVLIHAAAGGVGIAATQIAKLHGAEVYGTASPAKHDAIKSFGVDVPLDYTKKDWADGLPKMDIALDAIGGKSFRNSYKLLGPGGRLICFGASSVVDGTKRNVVQAVKTLLEMPRFNLIKQMSQSKAVVGLNMLALWDDRQTLDPWIKPVMDDITEGKYAPVVAKAFSFEEAPEAHRYISERRNIGKVVLVP